MPTARLLVIAGPSGAGKDTIRQMFMDKHPDWHFLPSVTTRAIRAGEAQGVDYYFWDRKDFEDKKDQGEFLEWFEVTGNLYGTPRKPVEEVLSSDQNVILRKEVNGALEIKRQMPEAILVAIVPEKSEDLERRMEGRATDSEKLIKDRVELAEKEMQKVDQFDHIVTNPTGHPEKALTEIEKILKL